MSTGSRSGRWTPRGGGPAERSGPGRLGAVRRRGRRPHQGAVRRTAAGAAHRRFIARPALPSPAGRGSRRLRAGGTGGARPVAALHRPAGGGPAAAAPAGAGGPCLTGRGRGGGPAGHRRPGRGPVSADAGRRGSDRSRPRQPLPPARPGTGLRTGTAPRRGGAGRAHGRAGTPDRELRGAGGLGAAPGGRQYVDPLGPLRTARLHLPGRRAALARRRVELHHRHPAARGGRRPGGRAEPAGRPVRLLPAARRPLPPG